MILGIALAHATNWTRALQITPELVAGLQGSYDSVNLPIGPDTDLAALEQTIRIILDNGFRSVVLTMHFDGVSGYGHGWIFGNRPTYLAFVRRWAAALPAGYGSRIMVELCNEAIPARWDATTDGQIVSLYTETYPAAESIFKASTASPMVIWPLPEDQSPETAAKIGQVGYVQKSHLAGKVVSAHYYDSGPSAGYYPLFSRSSGAPSAIEVLESRLLTLINRTGLPASSIVLTEYGRPSGSSGRALWHADLVRLAADFGFQGAYNWNWIDGAGGGYTVSTDRSVQAATHVMQAACVAAPL